MGHGTDSGIELLARMLTLDPRDRCNTEYILNSRYWDVDEPCACLPSEIKVSQHLQCHELDVRRHREQQREQRLRRSQAAAGASTVSEFSQAAAQALQEAPRLGQRRSAGTAGPSPKRIRMGE